MGKTAPLGCTPRRPPGRSQLVPAQPASAIRPRSGPHFWRRLGLWGPHRKGPGWRWYHLSMGLCDVTPCARGTSWGCRDDAPIGEAALGQSQASNEPQGSCPAPEREPATRRRAGRALRTCREGRAVREAGRGQRPLRGPSWLPWELWPGCAELAGGSCRNGASGGQGSWSGRNRASVSRRGCSVLGCLCHSLSGSFQAVRARGAGLGGGPGSRAPPCGCHAAPWSAVTSQSHRLLSRAPSPVR